MNYLDTIARQGFGYLLFAGAVLVIFFLYKENRRLSEEKVDLANKRVQDLMQARDAYSSLSEASTKVAENTFLIVQNLQTLFNNIKKI